LGPSLIQIFFVDATYVVAFDHEATVNLISGKFLNDVAYASVRPASILRICGRMGEYVSNLLIG
jgi:hypothetical protein